MWPYATRDPASEPSLLLLLDEHLQRQTRYPVLFKPEMITVNPLMFDDKNSVSYFSLDAHTRET